MNFNLGIDTPATFNILLEGSTGTEEPFSKAIQAVAPPQAFSIIWSHVPDLGMVTVRPILAASPGQAICSEWTTVNTAQ